MTDPKLIPPEPPVAIIIVAERRAERKDAPLGAAERILAREHRSAIYKPPTGGADGGALILLVGSERSLQPGARFPDAVAAIRVQVIQHLLPMLHRFPLGGGPGDRQIDQLESRLFGREGAACLNHLTQAHMQ